MYARASKGCDDRAVLNKSVSGTGAASLSQVYRRGRSFPRASNAGLSIEGTNPVKSAQLVPALEGFLYTPLIYTYDLPARFMGCTNDSSYTLTNYVRSQLT